MVLIYADAPNDLLRRAGLMVEQGAKGKEQRTKNKELVREWYELIKRSLVVCGGF